MKIGLLSDVHANLPALDTILHEAPTVDSWIHAGDVVGYGPWPSETIARFRDEGIVSIQGNHDRAALGEFHDGFVGLPRLMAEWTGNQLDAADREYLDSLPVELDSHDGRIHVAHGAPGKPNERLDQREISPELLGDEMVLVLGHTHEQYSREFDAGTIVNPGSVGQPRDGDWRTAYAIVDLDAGTVSLHRLTYPTERIQKKARAYGFPEPIVSAYEQGGISPADLAGWDGDDVTPQDLGPD